MNLKCYKYHCVMLPFPPHTVPATKRPALKCPSAEKVAPNCPAPIYDLLVNNAVITSEIFYMQPRKDNIETDKYTQTDTHIDRETDRHSKADSQS